MDSEKSRCARQRKIQKDMKAAMLGLATALAKTGRCHPSDILPSYGTRRSAAKAKTHYSPDELVNTKQAGSILGLSPKTLENWRSQGGGPLFRKIGNRCHYRVSDLEAYLAAKRYGSTSEYKEGKS